tara:strand:- start:21138 stop:21287 length:150 start_codon:yes stop_codon:yes gene_type:complete
MNTVLAFFLVVAISQISPLWSANLKKIIQKHLWQMKMVLKFLKDSKTGI